MERNPAMDDYLFELAVGRAAVDGRDRPRICFLPTASGDADHYLVKFYRRFAGMAECTHLSCFRRERHAPHPGEHLLRQDMIYVGGGSIVSLMGTWTAHGWPLVLQAAYEDGIVCCGLSAGALCWGADGISRFNPWPQHFTGLSLLPHSTAVHYTNEPHRREEFVSSIGRGEIPPGYGLSDGAALHFVDERLHEVLTTVEGALAVRVDVDPERIEQPLGIEAEQVDEPGRLRRMMGEGAVEVVLRPRLLVPAEDPVDAVAEWREEQRFRRGEGR